MKAFTRTNSGIANYHKFYGADFTVFIEGKINTDNLSEASERCGDVEYYEAVLKAASRGRNPKIKCVGNKKTALEYAKKIQNGSIPKSMVVVDKDLEGITCSPLEIDYAMRTFGYSWESELWSIDTIVSVVQQITNSNRRAELEVLKRVPILARRVKYISLLDAAAQVDGKSLLKKSSALCGVNFNFPELPSIEIDRLAESFRELPAYNCPISREVVRRSSAKEPCEIIQGHFWSNIATKLITYVYRKYTRDSMPSNALIERLALSHVRTNPAAAIGPKLIARYGSELVRMGI
jgi:hypothetical protein